MGPGIPTCTICTVSLRVHAVSCGQPDDRIV
eukprot:COSAG05_NODE_15457_length_369_cov_0.692593_1_plen_30_part_01